MRLLTRPFLFMIFLASAILPLAAPASAQISQTTGNLDFSKDKVALIVGIVAVAATVAIIVVVHHRSGNRTITGCPGPVSGGESLTNENDKRVYHLTGDTTALQPGHRMSLRVAKLHTKDTAEMWQIRKAKDLGVCPQ